MRERAIKEKERKKKRKRKKKEERVRKREKCEKREGERKPGAYPSFSVASVVDLQK